MSRYLCLAVYLLAAALCYVSCEELTKEHFIEVANNCKAESGATDDDVAELLKHEVADSHDAKCMRACVMKKFEIMDDTGKISKEHAIAMVKAIHKDNAEKAATGIEIVEKCDTDDTSEDHCEAAAMYESCIYTHMQELGLTTDDE